MFTDRLDEISSSARNSIRLANEIHCARALNLASDAAVHLSGDSSHLARKDTTGLGGEFCEKLRILEADLFERKVETLSGHRLIVLTEINPSLNGLRLRHDK